MGKLTGAGLAEYAVDKIGMPYFYGAKISQGILTEQFMEEIHRKFPELADNGYLDKARRKRQVGRVNVDCSGLVGAYRGRERATSQLYATARMRMPMEGAKDFAVGTVLWKPGHVGIYIGKIYQKQLCVEAKGIDYGVIVSKIEDTDWKMGLTFPEMRYDYQKKVTGTRKGENPFMEPAVPVMHPEDAASFEGGKAITRGEGVRWLQWELKEAGYSLRVDGVFGDETRRALIVFETSCELMPDGIAGKAVRTYLTVLL